MSRSVFTYEMNAQVSAQQSFLGRSQHGAQVLLDLKMTVPRVTNSLSRELSRDQLCHNCVVLHVVGGCAQGVVRVQNWTYPHLRDCGESAGMSRRSSSWLGGLLLGSPEEQPVDRFSIEYLRHLREVLIRNPVVTDANRDDVVETLRSIAEIMVWGDQHDPRFLDYFLENNILQHFNQILQQRSNRRGEVAIQVLQTLSMFIQVCEGFVFSASILPDKAAAATLFAPPHSPQDGQPAISICRTFRAKQPSFTCSATTT